MTSYFQIVISINIYLPLSLSIPNPPIMRTSLIIIDGLNGSGKTTIAKQLHRDLKRTAVIHWDYIKRLISDFEPNSKDLRLTGNIVKLMAREYLKNDINVIIESFFPRKEYIEELTKLARDKKSRVHLFVYQIEAPFKVRAQRIRTRNKTEGVKKRMTKKWIKSNDVEYFAHKYTKAKVLDSSQKTSALET